MKFLTHTKTFASIAKASGLMLLWEVLAIYSGNHVKSIQTL
jgi:hypothetical protein